MKFYRQLLIESELNEAFNSVYDKFVGMANILKAHKTNIKAIKKLSENVDVNIDLNALNEKFEACKENFNQTKKVLSKTNNLNESKSKYQGISASHDSLKELSESLTSLERAFYENIEILEEITDSK